MSILSVFVSIKYYDMLPGDCTQLNETLLPKCTYNMNVNIISH